MFSQNRTNRMINKYWRTDGYISSRIFFCIREVTGWLCSDIHRDIAISSFVSQYVSTFWNILFAFRIVIPEKANYFNLIPHALPYLICTARMRTHNNRIYGTIELSNNCMPWTFYVWHLSRFLSVLVIYDKLTPQYRTICFVYYLPYEIYLCVSRRLLNGFLNSFKTKNI